MVGDLSNFPAANISFLKIFLMRWKMLDHSMGPQKWKYKKGRFFDFALKVMICFNLETSEMNFGRSLGHILKFTKD